MNARPDKQEAAKVVPATPLPWIDEEINSLFYVTATTFPRYGVARLDGPLESRRQDMAYIIHSCNAYHKLVAALAVFAREACDDPRVPDTDAFDVDHAITEGDVRNARALLRELGEL